MMVEIAVALVLIHTIALIVNAVTLLVVMVQQPTKVDTILKKITVDFPEF